MTTSLAALEDAVIGLVYGSCSCERPINYDDERTKARFQILAEVAETI